MEKKSLKTPKPSAEEEAPLGVLIAEAQKAFAASQRQPRLSLEQAKEIGRRTSRSPEDLKP